MVGFISEIVPKRNTFGEEEIKQAIADAEAEMIRNGIVAVGDISNTDHSFEQKTKGNLFYHTFIELFDLDESKTKPEFEKGLELQKVLDRQSSINDHRSSLVPHAPYSVTPDLFALINELKQEIICIHNQESKPENELFVKKSGELYDRLYTQGFHLDWIEETGKNSIRSTLPLMFGSKRIQLVHNTFTSKKDLSWAQSFVKDPVPGAQTQLYWCTCPNANLFIENKLPDYKLFMDAGAKMTIGTDSYASNHSLSILDEMKTIQRYFPMVKTETLIQWATINGAEFLGLERTFGSIEPGKKPGLNLIEGIDPESLQLTNKSKVTKLI